ncbi:MAG: Spy/CpxP family protein refolding chaperone [Deltaproteobacteria bacterium]|nr:Spy/CpxP family protein refolding chaperone [Deltaproteobacteria bacterium]
MKQRSIIIIGISALALAVAVPLAFAGGPGRRGGGGWGDGFERGARIAEKLGLNEAQKAELKVLREDLQTDVQDIREQIRAKHVAMKDLWKAATPDRAKILAAHKELGALEQQIAELRVDFMFAVKGKLTPEQFTKFMELRGHGGGKGMRGWHKGGRGGFGPRDGSGPGGGFGPGACDGTGPCGRGAVDTDAP